MKQPAAYYLLLLYCTLMIKCAVPVACDTLSHFFNEEAHIATVHAVYGSHHLQAEVAGSVADTQPSKHVNAQQDEPMVVHIFTPSYSRICTVDILYLSHFSLQLFPLCSLSIPYISEPPERC